MASVRQAGGRTEILAFSSTVGRNTKSWIQIDDLSVSQNHATITYVAGRWLIEDHSTNGTFVDGRRLGRIRSALEVGQHVRFGGDAVEAFEVLDLDPPEPIAARVDAPTDRQFGEDGVLEIEAGGARMVIEQIDDVWHADGAPVGDQSVQMVGGIWWQLHLPTDLPRTMVVPDEAEWTLVLRPSAGIEEIVIELRQGDAEPRALGTRTHGYLLYVLALALDGDLRDGLVEPGWMDVVAILDELSLDAGRDVLRPQLNMHVLRFRELMRRHGMSPRTGPRLERRGDHIRLAGRIQLEPPP